MTVLEPRQAYTLLAEDYDSTPNALIALEERTVAPLLLTQLSKLPACVDRSEPEPPQWHRLPAHKS